MKRFLARLFGTIGCYFVDRADRLDPDWTIEPRLVPFVGELDEEWTAASLPTMPSPPPLPDFDREEVTASQRPCTRPGPHPSSRRVFMVGEGRTESVTPPPGTGWSQGGRA